MIHKLKTLGVALVAVLALTAVAASAASAANYTASSYPTTGTGTSPKGNDTFTTEAGNVECASHFQGTLTEESSSLTVTPTYTECRAFGFLSATVSMGTCDYLFTAPTGSGDSYTAPVDVTCVKTGVEPKVVHPIVITAGTCEAQINAQSPGGVVNITNNTAAGDVFVQSAVTGVAYTVTKDGFGCPFNGTGAKTGASYTQHSAITFDSTNGASIHVG
jgi:hypothetical protein